MSDTPPATPTQDCPAQITVVDAGTLVPSHIEIQMPAGVEGRALQEKCEWQGVGGETF